MNMKFCGFVAGRYLTTRRKEAFIFIITLFSVLGIAIGVAVLNLVMSIMTGFERELKTKLLGSNPHITIRAPGQDFHLTRELLTDINSIKNVTTANPFTYHQALIKGDGSLSGILVRGVHLSSPETTALATFLPNKELINELEQPQPIPSGATLPGIIIGGELARNQKLIVGSAVSILSSGAISSPFGLAPRFRRFKVVAIFDSGLTDYESALVYMSIENAQRFFEINNKYSGIAVTTHNPESVVETANAINKILPPPLYATDWTVSNKPFFDALKLEKRVYFIVLLLIIVMASFSVVSSLIMLVLEKRGDIALLKSIGATDKQISGIFKLQGAFIGLVGVSVGTLLGYAGGVGLQRYGFPLDERIFQMATVPIVMLPENFIAVAICGFVISYLAALYPAYRAAKLVPVDVLRYE